MLLTPSAGQCVTVADRVFRSVLITRGLVLEQQYGTHKAVEFAGRLIVAALRRRGISL
jgi:hypothetical protein